MIAEVSSFSIVIPFYNEATCLTPVVREIETVIVDPFGKTKNYFFKVVPAGYRH